MPLFDFNRAMTAKDINEKSCPMNLGGAFGARHSLQLSLWIYIERERIELIGNFCLRTAYANWRVEPPRTMQRRAPGKMLDANSI